MNEIMIYGFWMLITTTWSMKNDATFREVYFRYVVTFIAVTAGLLITRGIK